jgi:hypothetical protein
MNNSPFERRRFIKSSAFGLIGITTFGIASATENKNGIGTTDNDKPVFYRYPSIDDDMASSIVGASHRDIDKVKQLVTQRPELARASWDWGFGDWETALGAASHVGRRDIAELLMSHGARPDIFTFAMMGMIKSVQEIIETVPGIQTQSGPHGITLLQHAKNRLTDKSITAEDKTNVEKVVIYLESLGNADMKAKSLDITDEEKQKYIGEYRFGSGDGESFILDMNNSRKILQMSRKGKNNLWLRKVGDDTFSPPGASSVKIIFKIDGNKAVSLSIHEPEPLITATRI